MRVARIIVVGEAWRGSNVTSLASGLEEIGAEIDAVDVGWGEPVQPIQMFERISRRLLAPGRQRLLEQRMVEMVRRARPDAVLIYSCPWMGGDLLRALRRAGAGLLLHFWPDIPFYGEPSPLAEALGEFDLLLTPKSFHVPRLRASRARDVVFMPYGADPLLHRPVEVREEDCQRYGATIGFVGHWRDYRERQLACIAHHGVAIYGRDWVKNCRSDALRASVRGPVFGLEFSRVFASSTLGLNLLTTIRGVTDIHTARSFEAPACGRPVLMPRTPEHESFFTEDEVFFFKDEQSLDEAVSRALEHSAELSAVGRRGLERVRAQHLYRHRMAALLDYLGLPRAPGPAWPTLASASVE